VNANVAADPGYEGQRWALSGTPGYATYQTALVHAGARSIRLRGESGSPPLVGRATSPPFRVIPGQPYQFSYWRHANQVVVNHRLLWMVRRASDHGVIQVDLAAATVGGSWVQRVRPQPIVPLVERLYLQVEASAPTGAVVGATAWHVDDVAFDGPEDLMARSKLTQFLENLKAVVESIDPGIGVVLVAPKRWSSDQQMRDAGAVLQISVAGLFDDIATVGQHVTRFWILEGDLVPKPMTTCSDEYKATVNLIAFWGHRDDTDQLARLREASIEIVDKLALRETEQSDLAASMGDGYMGYLDTRPAMDGPVRSAVIEDIGAQGYTCRIRVNYFEEVPRE